MALNFNNPGNIRLTSETWLGQIKPGDSTSFVTFQNQVYGYRALFKLILNYIKSGYNNINRIIYKYAPPGDNNPTVQYADFVSNRTGISKETTIYPNDYHAIYLIGLAISRFETGAEPNTEAAKSGLEMVFNPEAYGDESNPNGFLVLFGLMTFAALIAASKRKYL